MKRMSVMMALLLCVAMLAGCAGTPVVYYTNCTCPAAENCPVANGQSQQAETQAPAPAGETTADGEGLLKTGLTLVTKVSDSKSATAEENGQAKYDVTVVAVTLDENDIIRGCIIDGITTAVKFDAAGVLNTELGAVATKNQLGENYGMVAYGKAIAEWDQQAAALASFAIGKTVEELRSGAIDETGHAPAGSDLASSATIYLGGYVSAIEEAAANAQSLGAQAGDTLKLAVIAGNDSSAAATEEKAGNAQLDVNVAAVTMDGDTITSCIIDSVQAKVGFDTTGTITSDISVPVATKNQLGENYGMKAWGKAIAEWNEQAASFAAYVTGKTAQEVAGIAIDEKTKPVEADLATSVTISIGGFQALIAQVAE